MLSALFYAVETWYNTAMSETKMGRPPLPEAQRKTRLVRTYLTEKQLESIRHAAKKLRQAPSDYIREAALEKAGA